MTPFRTLSALVLACLLAVNVQAVSFDEPPANLAHLAAHRRLVQRRSAANGISPARVRRQNGTRCKVRQVTPTPEPTPEPSSSPAPAEPTPTPAAEPAPAPEQPQAQPEQNNNNNQAATPDPAPAPAPAAPISANVVPGLLNVQSNCGDIGATCMSFL